MKTIYLMGFIFLGFFLLGQTPVTDAGANTQQQLINRKLENQNKINRSIDKAIESVENIQQSTKKALENARWAKTLKSTSDFINLTEKTVCSLHDFYNYTDIPNVYKGSSCLSELGIDTSLLKMQNAYESFYLALTNGIAMSVKERLETLKNAREDFEKATQEIERENNNLRKIQSNRNLHQKNKEIINVLYP